MALDNEYAYTTVAITSMMENSYANTKYDYYIMIPSDFSIKNQRKFLNLENIYKCSITFIDMKEQFKTAKTVRYLTTLAYYRLALPHLLPHINKFYILMVIH